MRKGIGADSRLPFESLFFDGNFHTPLTPAKAGKLAEPLEMVRWAPSAVNKQPWRALVMKDVVHFYEKKSPGFVNYHVGDMQKIDLGIALYHFALMAKETDLKINFFVDEPDIEVSPDMEYIASYSIL